MKKIFLQISQKLTDFLGQANIVGEKNRKVIFFMAIVFIGIILYFFYNSYTISNKEKYELQEQCGKTAREWFSGSFEDFAVAEVSVTYSYTNHYNKKLNKCFVLVKHYTYYPKNKQDSSFSLQLLDVNENKMYGIFGKYDDGRINGCGVTDKRCDSEAQWDALAKPYMEE